MSLSPGTKLGPYEIVAPIGAGGMGEVYRARDARLNREVAIKVVPESLASNPEALARFEREAQAVAALNHPNILSIHDFGSENGVVYAATELLDGETLRERLDGGAMPQRRAVEVATQIARGLAAAHEKGILHRDLKPENLFLTRDGRVKILDFGLAKVVGREKTGTSAPTSPAGTEPGTVMGTVGYMSPEQVLGRDVDSRTDIFSFGAILFEMLSGARAFRRNSHIETMNAILKEEPPELAATGKIVSPALDRIVRHCLEKNPEARFHSAGDVAFDLEAVSDPSSTGSLAKLSPARRRPALRSAILGLAAAVLVAAAYRIGRGRAAPTARGFSRLTFRPQFVTNARFAPDGKTIVFSAAPEGNRNELFVKDAQSPQPRSLALPDTRLLAVSSKGELAVLTHASYMFQRIYLGTLARMPIGEASPRELLKDVHDAEWSPDGSALAIVRRVEGTDRLEYPVGKPIATIGGYFSDVRISPDGTRVAFMRHPIATDDRGDVEIVDRSGRRIASSPEYSGEEGLAWSTDGREVFFSASGDEGTDLSVRALDASSRVRSVLVNSESLTLLDIAPDGRLLVEAGTTRASVIAGGEGTSGERDLSLYDYSVADAVSRDGKTILFSEDTAGAGPYYAVCLRRTDGSPAVRLGDGNGLNISADGASVLASVFTTPPKLVIYPTGAGEPRDVSLKGFDSYDVAQFTHADARIFFCGARSGQASRCWVTDVKGGEPRPVTPLGTIDGKISPDESSIAAKDASGGWAIYPAAGGAPTRLPELSPEDAVSGWTADGRALMVYGVTLVPTRAERFDLGTRKRVLIREVGPSDRAGVGEISPVCFSSDEKTYVYSCFRQAGYLFVFEGAR